jgi:hypothetical protein
MGWRPWHAGALGTCAASPLVGSVVPKGYDRVILRNAL